MDWNAAIIEYSRTAGARYLQKALRASAEFDALCDYVFKIPSFIEAQADIEWGKLEDRYPISDKSRSNIDSRNCRISLEFPNIYGRFPRYINSSNIMISVSQFEYHIVDLVRCHGAHIGVSVKPHMGISQAMDKVVGWAPGWKFHDLYDVVDSVIKIRNRIVHDGGRISNTNKCIEIIDIVNNRRYAPKSHRDHWDKIGSDTYLLGIEDRDGESWIGMGWQYPHLVAAYLRESYISACMALDPACAF